MVRYALSEKTLIQRVAGESVLLDLESGCYYGLDEVGTRMLELVRDEGGVEKVVAAIVAEYDVTEDRVRTDLMDLLAKLEEHGLVHRAA